VATVMVPTVRGMYLW